MSALPRKQCGACKVCCSELKIAVPEFHKQAGVLCPHHTGTGCGIYPTRYQVCQEFLCGWRLSAELDESWRPDRNGVLILHKAADSLPSEYRAPGYGLQFDIIGGEAAVRRPGFVRHVAGLMARGVAVYLSASSPPTLLNEHLDPARAAKDLAGTGATLLRLHALLAAAAWRNGLFRRIAPLYRLQLDRLRVQAMRRTKNIKSK